MLILNTPAMQSILNSTYNPTQDDFYILNQCIEEYIATDSLWLFISQELTPKQVFFWSDNLNWIKKSTLDRLDKEIRELENSGDLIINDYIDEDGEFISDVEYVSEELEDLYKERLFLIELLKYVS